MSDVEMADANDNRIQLSTASDGEVERKELFSIDGTSYYIINKPRPNVALKAFWNLKTKGEEIAQMELLIDMIGEDAYQALMNYDGLTVEDLERITKIANDTAMGTLEEAKAGN